MSFPRCRCRRLDLAWWSSLRSCTSPAWSMDSPTQPVVITGAGSVSSRKEPGVNGAVDSCDGTGYRPFLNSSIPITRKTSKKQFSLQLNSVTTENTAVYCTTVQETQWFDACVSPDTVALQEHSRPLGHAEHWGKRTANEEKKLRELSLQLSRMPISGSRDRVPKDLVYLWLGGVVLTWTELSFFFWHPYYDGLHRKCVSIKPLIITWWTIYSPYVFKSKFILMSNYLR